MPLSVEHLEKEIVLLKDRNIRVEQEKAWENSTQRKMSIIIITYFVMILAFWSLGNNQPFLNALIPTLGYTLSTLSMGWMKNYFINKNK